MTDEPLSSKSFETKNGGGAKLYLQEDVAEAVAKLKEEIGKQGFYKSDYNDIIYEIDKIFGQELSQ